MGKRVVHMAGHGIALGRGGRGKGYYDIVGESYNVRHVLPSTR